MIFRTLLYFILINCISFAQEITSITVSYEDKSFQIPAYNQDGNVYIGIESLADALYLDLNKIEAKNQIEIKFDHATLVLTSKNPYVILRFTETGESKIFQLSTSTHLISKKLFAPLNQFLEIVREVYAKQIFIVSPNRLMVLDNEITESNFISKVLVVENDKGSLISVFYSNKIRTILNDKQYGEFRVILKNSSTLTETVYNLDKTKLIENLEVDDADGDVELRIETQSNNSAVEIINREDKRELLIQLFERPDSDWLEKESKHFKIVYREHHSHLVNHILASAENALQPLMEIFNYQPSEKIIINTYDVSDYGFGGTTTVPQNFIRLEIEPLEPGYEVVPYNERYQWLISHELVHIVVNDQSTGFETFFRNIFGKVPPEKSQPMTIIYSLLTNFNRYTPRWYQEAIAVFIETWFSGGYGRILGSFDEMYYRTFILEGKPFPSQLEIETILSHNSMLLETVFYLYGARFISFLAINYSRNAVINWFKTESGKPLSGFEGRFENIFGKNFYKVWKDFVDYEINFEEENIKILETSNVTRFDTLGNQKFGWVTKPYFDYHTNSVIFGYHRPHQLAAVQKLSLEDYKSKELTTLPTPSMLQVTSTAFDEANGLFFYTTNNNQLYRDIWVYDIETDDQKMLFENARVGDLTVSPAKHDLWGVQHQSGIITLMFSQFPFRDIEPIFTFNVGDELFHLAINGNGDKLAAVYKRASGQQSIIVIDVEKLVEDGIFDFITLSSSGTPENPSWSKDGRYLYWNAFTNGVSNIYKFDFNNFSLTAISHCLTGLFKPIEITPDSIFAFEYSIDGFIPVTLSNKPADHLPAINYLGQKILEKDPELFNWNLPSAELAFNPLEFSKEKSYNGLSNLKFNSFIPIVSGFQNQVVFGIFSRITDPLLLHDFIFEAGISPLKEIPDYPLWHVRFKYDFKQLFYIDVSYNGPDFFDLFNSRKRGMLGTKIQLGYTYYWKYDQPHKIKQASTLTFYRGVEYINDNLVSVSQPDFGVLVTNINSKNLRKSIGSSDFEQGTDVYLTFSLYGTEFVSPQLAFNTYLEYSDFSTWLWNHNVLHVKFAGGYLLDNENLVQARFYFGGFGNRGIDNDEIRQFRKVFRYPGIPIYSLMTDRFAKMMIENDFPPWRIRDVSIWHQFVNHIDFTIYSQGMITKSDLGNYWIDIGAQLDIKFKHWYNLESTFSAGIAKAWSEKINDWEWFLSIKLLKD